MTDEALMQQIRDRWVARIKQLEPGLRPFVAALIANESGGDPDATRYEPAVFRHLALTYPDWPIEKLTENSHSWGLTQIMGYHYDGSPEQLCVPETALNLTVGMIHGFIRTFRLAENDWESLFRCWNTGHPQGKTFDPEYVSKGLLRMQLWQQQKGV